MFTLNLKLHSCENMQSLTGRVGARTWRYDNNIHIHNISRTMLFLFFTFPVVTISKLVINHDEIGEYSMDDMKAEGEFIKTERVPHPSCDFVDEQHDLYRYFVREQDGSETEEIATIKTVVDVTFDTEKIINFHERWIFDYIFIRLKFLI